MPLGDSFLLLNQFRDPSKKRVAEAYFEEVEKKMMRSGSRRTWNYGELLIIVIPVAKSEE